MLIELIFFTQKRIDFGFSKGKNMGPAILNQCDISVGVFEACLDLSFHLCIHLLSVSCYRRHPIFPAAAEFHQSFCYSLWRPYLNGSGLTLTVHSCLHIYQSILSSIFYLSVHQEAPLPLCYRYRVLFFSKTPHKMLFLFFFSTCILLPVCYSRCPFVLHPPLHTSSLLWQHSFLSGHPSIFKHHLSSPFPSLLLLNTCLLFFFFLPSITNQPFHGNISLRFSHLRTLSTLLLLGFFYLSSSPLPHHPPPTPAFLIQNLAYLAGVTAADVARPQTSVSPVPAASLLCWSD